VNVNQLRAFVKVIQTKSYKEAASLLAVSQPAITQRVQALEEHFHTKLLLRHADGVQVTAQGEHVYTQAQQILALWDELERRLLGHKLEGRLVIGASTVPSEYYLPALIQQYRLAYPDVLVQLRVSGSHKVTGWLKERTVDVCITGKPEPHPGLLSYPLFADELQIIVPPEKAWLDRIGSFEDLFEVEWVLREPESDTRRTWERELRQRGCHVGQLKIAGQMGSADAVVAAVEAGLGASVVSSLAAKRALACHRAQLVRLDGFAPSRRFYLSCMEDHRNSPLVASFLAFQSRYQPQSLRGQTGGGG
jgi:DNA-binding transcriptional LysR family regulator